MDKKLAESHRRQFDGEDYQQVAIELSDGDEGLYDALSSSPDPGCAYAFCKQAEWQD